MITQIQIQIYSMIPLLLTKYLTHLYTHIPQTMSASNLTIFATEFRFLIARNIFCFTFLTFFMILLDLNHITPVPAFRYCILVLSCLHGLYAFPVVKVSWNTNMQTSQKNNLSMLGSLKKKKGKDAWKRTEIKMFKTWYKLQFRK